MNFGLWVILSSVIPLIRGECGFPGRPKFGSVRINETVVEPDGSTYESDTNATYWCDLPVETEDPSDRVCQPDGRWTGSVPECLNNLALSATASVHNTKSGNVSCEAIQDGYADSCTAGCFSGTLFQFDFDGNYRIDSIAIYDAGSSSKARVTPRGILAHKSADLRLGLTSLRKFNQSTYVHVSVLDQRFWRSIQLLFERVPKDFILCEVKIHGFPDECGEPEVPSNGHVHRFGSSAIYRCDPGFRLEPNAAVRNCTGGLWPGQQPVCVLHVNVPGEFLVPTSDGWTWAVIGFIGGLVVLVTAMVAIFLISKERFVRQRKRSATLLQTTMSKDFHFDKCKEHLPAKSVEENLYEELKFVCKDDHYEALQAEKRQERGSNDYEDPISVMKTNDSLDLKPDDSC